MANVSWALAQLGAAVPQGVAARLAARAEQTTCGTVSEPGHLAVFLWSLGKWGHRCMGATWGLCRGAECRTSPWCFVSGCWAWLGLAGLGCMGLGWVGLHEAGLGWAA